jgi:hypothetical protein
MGVVQPLNDPQTTLRVYPMSMARFGTNPYGEPLWRIVFAESRKYLVGGTWGDGLTEYRWRPTYRHITDLCLCGQNHDPGTCPDAPKWVLEKWLSAKDFTQGQSEQAWNLKYSQPCGLLLLGPYPSRGEYQHAHTFMVPVADANLDWLISVIDAGARKSMQDNLDACRADYDADTKARRSTVDEMVRNRMSSFLNNAFVGGAGVKRGTKTAPLIRTANELKLPTGNNKFRVMKPALPARP